jgi:N-acetylglucosamine transport system substrate-binding protein
MSSPDRGVGRRGLLRGAVAAGLAVGTGAPLASCVMGDDAGPVDHEEGAKSAENPLGVKDDAALSVVIFKGGYGDEYATAVHEPMYKKRYPRADIKHSSTQEVAKTLQPLFAAGNPPDFVNNNGSGNMDFGGLVKEGHVQDLSELLDAPSVDIPGKKVRETLQPGTVEWGAFNGKPLILNYVYYAFGVWYSAKLFKDRGWVPPGNWSEFLALCEEMKKAGLTPWAYPGKNAQYYQFDALLTAAARLGGPDVLEAIDNLQPGAWKQDAVRTSADMWAEVGAKYMDKATEGLIHTEGQLRHNQGKIGLYPCGSWLENEQKKQTPPGFDYAMMPLPALSGSDRMPATTLHANPGEPYFVCAKGKNPRGGMEYLRMMLSNEGARGFVKLTGSLTSVTGSSDGVPLPPGLASAVSALKTAGTNLVGFRFDGWYKELETELRTATNELMFGRINATAFCDRMQKKADAVAADPGVEKFTR